MENSLKAKLLRGGRPLGTFLELGSPFVVEAIGRAGLDFIIIDTEHGPFEAESTAEYVRAAEAVGLVPLARVRETSRPAVLKILDVGAQGIIVPDVHTVAQVRTLVEYARFAPLGKRGFCPTRKDGWGFDYPFGESLGVTMTRYDSEILLIPQCETVGCLNSIEEIIALEGVDGIFIGPFDLSISMGIPGEFDHPDFIRALGRVRNACRAAGKFTIYFTVHEDKVADGFRSGFDAMTYSMDARVLIQAYRDAVRRIRLNTGQ